MRCSVILRSSLLITRLPVHSADVDLVAVKKDYAKFLSSRFHGWLKESDALLTSVEAICPFVPFAFAPGAKGTPVRSPKLHQSIYILHVHSAADMPECCYEKARKEMQLVRQKIFSACYMAG